MIRRNRNASLQGRQRNYGIQDPVSNCKYILLQMYLLSTLLETLSSHVDQYQYIQKIHLPVYTRDCEKDSRR